MLGLMRTIAAAATATLLTTPLSAPLGIVSSGAAEVVASYPSRSVSRSIESVDAVQYAAMTGVTLQEAEERLALQDAIGGLGDVLESQEPDTFGGLYIDHFPEYRLVVQFTRDGSATIRPYLHAQPFESIVEIEETAYSWSKLLNDLNDIREQLGDGIDVPMNRVLVQVLASTDLESLAGSERWAPPASARVVVVESLPTPSLALYGGLALSTCTSGFSIYKGSNPSNRAITTAGHCQASQTYNGNALTYQNDQNISGSHDEQSHKRSGGTYPNRIDDGLNIFPYYREITSTKSRAQQSVGDFVCHYGKTTGYGCGYIVSRVLTPCGGGANPASTAIKVDSDPDGEGFDLSEGGDSGGPWFINNAALGTMSCQQGFDAIYVAANYVESGLGATILTSP